MSEKSNIWQQRFVDLGRHNVAWQYTPTCLEGDTRTGVRYTDTAMEPYIRLFRVASSPDFILIDDKVRQNRTHMVDDILESEDVRQRDRPARSPNLNPVKHVYEALRRAITTNLKGSSSLLMTSAFIVSIGDKFRTVFREISRNFPLNSQIVHRGDTYISVRRF